MQKLIVIVDVTIPRLIIPCSGGDYAWNDSRLAKVKWARVSGKRSNNASNGKGVLIIYKAAYALEAAAFFFPRAFLAGASFGS